MHFRTKVSIESRNDKKNLDVKRGIIGINNEGAYDHSKRMRTGDDRNPAAHPPPSAFVSPHTPAWPLQSFMLRGSIRSIWCWICHCTSATSCCSTNTCGPCLICPVQICFTSPKGLVELLF